MFNFFPEIIIQNLKWKVNQNVKYFQLEETVLEVDQYFDIQVEEAC